MKRIGPSESAEVGNCGRVPRKARKARVPRQVSHVTSERVLSGPEQAEPVGKNPGIPGVPLWLRARPTSERVLSGPEQAEPVGKNPGIPGVPLWLRARPTSERVLSGPEQAEPVGKNPGIPGVPLWLRARPTSERVLSGPEQAEPVGKNPGIPGVPLWLRARPTSERVLSGPEQAEPVGKNPGIPGVPLWLRARPTSERVLSGPEQAEPVGKNPGIPGVPLWLRARPTSERVLSGPEQAEPVGKNPGIPGVPLESVLQPTDSHAIGGRSFLERASGEGRREFRTWIDVPENVLSEALAPTAKPEEPVSVRLGIYYELAPVDNGDGADAQSVHMRIDIQADPPEILKAVQEEGTDAVAEFIASQLETVVLDKVLDSCHVLGEANLAEDVQIVIELDEKIHEIVIGKPVERLMFGLGLPGSPLMGSIIQGVPIEFIDKRLGAVRLGVEIGGFITSIATGNFILAYAYLKALIHDLAHRMLVSAIKDLINGGHSGTSYRGKALVVSGRIERRPNGAIHSVGQAEGRRALSEVTIARAASVGAAPAEARRVPGEATIASSSSSAASASSSSSAAPASSSSSAVPPEAAATVKPRVSGKRSEFREAGEVLTWAGGGLVHAGSGGWSAPVGKAEELTFVRLRIYYEIENPTVSGKDCSQSVRLMRLIVVRDSRRFILPEPSKMSADGTVEYIVRQLDRAASTKAWQLRRAADEDCYVLDAASAIALLSSLSRTLLGLPPELDSASFVVQEIPVESIDQLLDSDVRCIEIIGFTSRESENVKLQCLASKTLVHDKFWNVVSVMTK